MTTAYLMSTEIKAIVLIDWCGLAAGPRKNSQHLRNEWTLRTARRRTKASMPMARWRGKRPGAALPLQCPTPPPTIATLVIRPPSASASAALSACWFVLPCCWVRAVHSATPSSNANLQQERRYPNPRPLMLPKAYYVLRAALFRHGTVRSRSFSNRNTKTCPVVRNLNF